MIVSSLFIPEHCCPQKGFNLGGTSFVYLSNRNRYRDRYRNRIYCAMDFKKIILSLSFIRVLFLAPGKVPKEARPAAWRSAAPQRAKTVIDVQAEFKSPF
ncbi:MAG: hypothetical protein ACOZBW_00540 [Thermodesulfobacteriota bacterium]